GCRRRAGCGAGARPDGARDGRHRRGCAGRLGAEWAGAAHGGGGADRPAGGHEWRRLTLRPPHDSRTGEHADPEPRARRPDLERHASVSATTPWERGRLGARRGKPRLLFGQMYEDWDVEAEVLPAAGRVFCIDSAGATSMALAARGLAVTAVDINPLPLRAIYSSTFVRVLPKRFDRVIRARLERCWARHPNRSNPYAWRFFLGMDPPDYVAPTLRSAVAIELVCADAAMYLENCPPASFIGFSLSNILDGTEPAYGERLMAAVRHSAQDGAVVLLRSF